MQAREHTVRPAGGQQRHLFAQTRCHPAEQEVIAVLREVDDVCGGRQRRRHVLGVGHELRGADHCALVVRDAGFEPVDGQQIKPGHVYIAPGGKHLLVERDGAHYRCRINDGPPVNRHRPSVDVLFRSIAQNVGPNAVGVILTGMGDDGARGLKEMHDAGAPTLAQDEATSVVWGMPGAAVKLGGDGEVLPLGRVAEAIMRLTESVGAPAAMAMK